MTKKMVIIIFMAIFLFQGFMLMATDEVKKEVPKKIRKMMKKGAKYLAKGNKATETEKKDNYYKDALEQYNKVLKIDEKFAPAYFQMSFIYSAKKDMKHTIVNLEKTIAIDPKHQLATEYLAKMYLKESTVLQQKKDFAKMLEYKQKFVDMPFAKEKMAADYSMSLYLMGYYYSLSKNFKKSNEYLAKHAELFKDKEKPKTYHFAIYMLGLNSHTLMEEEIAKENARKDINKAKAIVVKYSDIDKYLAETVKAPQAKWTEDAGLRLGTYFIYKGDKEKAKATIENLIKTYPTSKDIELYKNLLKNTIEKLK